MDEEEQVMQDPRQPMFLLIPLVIAVSGVATLLFATGGVGLADRETLPFSGPDFGSVLLEGESTSDPADGWNTYPTTVSEGLGGATVIADGINGDRIDHLNGEGSKGHLVTDDQDVAVLWIGINDIAEGNNPAVVYDQMATWVATRRAEGWDQVVVLTVTKFENSRSEEPDSWGSHELADDARQQLNELIVLNQAGADAVLDLRTIEGIGDGYSVENQQWRSDKVHFTPEGYERVAEQLLATLSQLSE